MNPALISRALRLVLRPSAPLRQGTVSLPGLLAPVTIRRDAYDVPYIDAANDDDAWYALGFCQAQDRAFQLELRMRTARGTLSELIGEPTLPIDRISRRIGFVQAAQRQVEVLDPDVRAQVEAFVRGINAGLAAGMKRRPPEFVLLRAKPTAWTAADVAGTGQLMAFLLLGNWDVELARLKILTEDGAEALHDLDPVYPEAHAVSTPLGASAGPALDRLSADLDAFIAFSGQGGGSNGWAISGSRTASGRAILANDPHLDPALPPHWYLAHLRTPKWSAAGASLIGSPCIGIGHNGFAAWGITAGLADQTDLFIETVTPDGRNVRRGAGIESCEVRREVIKVKGRDDVIEDVLVTPRGPVIGPSFEGELGALSLRAAWLDAKPIRGFLRAHRARSLDAFRAEFEKWPLLSANVVYADIEGHIAWQLVGEAPVRRKGWGTMPQHAIDRDTGWETTGVPFADMPNAIDPPQDFVATANNKPQPDAANGPYLGVDWLDGYRQGRIVEALAARQDWDVTATMALHLDTNSLAWLEVRDAIRAIPAETSEARQGVTLLEAWNGDVSANSSAATVYALFVGEMWRRVGKARAPNSWQYALGRGFTEIMPGTLFAGGRWSRILGRLVEQPEGWFERGWPDEMADAMTTVVRDLHQRFGRNPDRWAWGNVRQLTLLHPLGRVPELAAFFNRGPYPWFGDGNTISQAATSPLRPLGNPGAIASLRAVFDVGNWEDCRWIMPGGQSGDPLSPHYDDQIELWRVGGGIPIAWAPESVSQTAVSTLQLRPL
jgi:penicillin amidase